MFPTNGYEIEEADLLRNLKEVWAQKEEQFKLVLDDPFASHREALFRWMEELRITSELQLMRASYSGVDTPALALKALVLNRVRVVYLRMRIIKANDGNEDLSLGNMLCRTLTLMTNTEGSELLFKKGVQKLRDTTFQEIRSADLAILI
ncbi:hypothetical protein PSPO01_03675 [Paraphaeosphaeria sporulosa]